MMLMLAVRLDGDTEIRLVLHDDDSAPRMFRTRDDAESFISGWRNCEVWALEVTGNIIELI